MRMKHGAAVLALTLAAFAGALLDGDGDGDSSLVLAQAPSTVTRDPGEATIIRVARTATPAVVSVTSRSGSGSGVVISTDGIILTNRHVVAGSRRVEIGLADSRRIEGEVLGSDAALDIAVVRVGARGLTAAPLGDSDRLEVGQTTVAIGNPVGLDRTVTTGIVSAVNRSPRGFELGGLIQTDAPINPGNSGGGLFDSQARLIGINTAILRGTTGLGFAIPINLARNIAEQLVATGRIVRPYLGVSTGELDYDAAARAGVDLREGVIVGTVDPRSPAGRAGIQPYDIVTRIDDAPITSSGELVRVLRSRRPGDTVRVTVRSLDANGRLTAPRVVQLRLAEMPVDP